MQKMLSIGGVNYPQLRCDGCGEPIEDATSGWAIFSNLMPAGALSEVHHAHGAGCRQAVIEHLLSAGQSPGQMGLVEFLAMLALNANAALAGQVVRLSVTGPATPSESA